MDIREETCNVIKSLNFYKDGELSKANLIKDICAYFDIMKNQKLNEADLKFLKYLSSFIGIPHFYDMLKLFNNNLDVSNIDLNTFASYLSESTLYLTESTKIHRYQKEIYDRFDKEQHNRYFLSASTSFGKTHLVFDILKKMKYKNVLLIFPTIALLAENFEKLLSKDDYSFFRENYKIHTLSEIDNNDLGDNNIFIYTPERFLSYIEKINKIKHFDFIFIDEVYKIDNEYFIDEELKESERDVAYRLASYYAIDPNMDILLAGPYIEFSPNKNSFNLFLEKNNITLLNYNEYEIVNKTYVSVGARKKIIVDGIEVNLSEKDNSKYGRLIHLTESLLNLGEKENVIIYCPTRKSAEKKIKKLSESIHLLPITDIDYKNFLSHIANTIGKEWSLYRALEKRMAFHHGLVPKYMQKEIINLFNRGEIKVLASTTTITEGVNTTAKNMIVTTAKKEKKRLKKFDAKNIAGRAGRFYQHYSGRVFVLDKDFERILNEEAEPIKHKNYDINAKKSDIDLQCTFPEYYNDTDKINEAKILQTVENSKLPPFIFEQYKIISRIDKVRMYLAISQLNIKELAEIQNCIIKLQYTKPELYLNGFQRCIDILCPFVKDEKMKFLMSYKGNNNTLTHCVLCYLLKHYLSEGFAGLIKYKIETKHENIDQAVSETSNFVYTQLKYQLVKYLGVFNLLYKYHLSLLKKVSFDDILGFDRLLSKLEYNAFSPQAKIASDYGATSNIIDYYEQSSNQFSQTLIKQHFDTYEQKLFEKIELLMPNK